MTRELKQKKAIRELMSDKISTRNDLMLAKRRVSKKYGLEILSNSEILSMGEKLDPDFKRLLRKRSVRTLSGIAPVAVLTKSYPCPGKCAYCPTEKDVPRSYLSNEPAVMRAIRCNFDPYTQVQERIRALKANGHSPEKIELIVIGGTWSVLPEDYKYWFIGECFRGANDFGITQKSKVKSQNCKSKVKSIKFLKLKLKEHQDKNENAKYRIIGITLETRPDYIDERELWEMRDLGCTRVELGVQAICDGVLKLNRRGHGVAEIAEATKLLKDFGFKVTYHLMPGLPGSTPAKDLKMFKQLFSDERFQPDQIKFYPTVVTKGSLLYRWWKAGKYKPYSEKVLKKLIIECKKAVPLYVRIIRLIRDIPGESIIAGNKITNLRQMLKSEGVQCGCIRCREVKENILKITNPKSPVGTSGPIRDYKLKITNYAASSGEEFFISCDSNDGKSLYGFCRLRLPSKAGQFEKSAILRELHVYGELMPVGKGKKVQHRGLGRLLLAEAEKIAKNKGYAKIVVISGIGVRAYYRKFGYKLKNTYMAKNL